MIVLGIHDGHCASACVMIDGRIKALAAEERFSRLKNDHGYPWRSIDFCLRQAGISPSDIDQVAFATKDINALFVKLKALSTFSDRDWIRIHTEYWRPKIYEGREDRSVFQSLASDPRFAKAEHFYDFSGIGADYQFARDRGLVRSIREEGVKRHLGIGPEKIAYYDHHTCHAAYGLFGSHIRQDNTMVYTLDGGGDSTVSTLFRFRDGRLEELARSDSVDIARIYREMTLILGMKLGEHEYKVMGLAPYATDREAAKSWAVFDGMFEVRHDLIAYADGRRPTDLYFFFREAFHGHRFDGIAAAVQRVTEDAVTRWMFATQQKYASRTAVFSGGVAMNVKLNMLLADHHGLDDFYVCPSPTDDTLCAGACYLAEAGTSRDAWQRLAPIDDPYLGPDYDRPAVEKAIAVSGVEKRYRVERGVTPDRAAEFLANGAVVARAAGRMEFGARALGNRSILADPRRREVVDRINRQIKYRDFWMPFAPVVLESRAEEYFVCRNKRIRRPYMMIAAETTGAGRIALAGGIHGADQTGRPQLINRSQNADYHDIVDAFSRRTGVGGLINTSFNLHGEPIVCSPDDAISTFERSELDALLLGDVAVLRGDGEA